MANPSKSFATRLKQAMNKKGFSTQKALANAVGIAANSMTNGTKKDHLPDSASLLKLMHVLDVSADWLLTGEETKGRTGKGFAPPMWDGSPQGWLTLGPDWLAALPCRPNELKVFEHDDGFQLIPNCGVALGDFVLVNTAQNAFVSDGLYVLELPTGPALRAVLKRPGNLLIERPLNEEGAQTLDGQAIPGHAVARAGEL